MPSSRLLAALYALAAMAAVDARMTRVTSVRPSVMAPRVCTLTGSRALRMQSDSTEPEAATPAAEPAAEAEPEDEKKPQWVDKDASANESFKLSWWGYPFLVYPVVLILNDFFHFLPKNFDIVKLVKALASGEP